MVGGVVCFMNSELHGSTCALDLTSRCTLRRVSNDNMCGVCVYKI